MIETYLKVMVKYLGFICGKPNIMHATFNYKKANYSYMRLAQSQKYI